MGFFGQFRFSNGVWDSVGRAEPYLVIDVHDSDVVTIDYSPVGDGASGRCFLGVEPRYYFDDTEASGPIDRALEARALSAWARLATGAAVDPSAIQALLADPEGGDPEEPFAEETLVRLLDLLELPIPEELKGDQGDVAPPAVPSADGEPARRALADMGVAEVTPETLGDFMSALRKHLD